ncbi:SDR family oxidoreductase [Aliagarivorans marinus]|uniref:SDR family oxidoreductase n=1 Tax=Aliagarivorans marinus TaxID=561965 RepID=UPI000415513C|nr:SDR family oxidoreductase [Aliagarivorans marinus]
MQTVVITGANRGIGLALTSHYLQQGWQVVATCRAPQSAHKLHNLAPQDKLQILPLDITDTSSRQQFVAQLHGKQIDLLINNAGVYGPKGYSLDELDFDAWQQTMQTNLFGTTALTLDLLPLMANPSKIAVISSKMGSMGDNGSGGSYIYRSSKAALNSVVKSLSIDLAPQGISLLCLHPGWVQTEMGGPRALIDTQTSAQGMAQQIEQLTPQTSGSFVDYSGKAVPW